MRYIFCWPTACTYSLFIIIMSLIPVEQPPAVEFPFLDKVIHGILYWLLAFIVANTLARRRKNRIVFISFIYSFGLGCLIECIQFFLPYRSFEGADIMVNGLGSLLGSFIRL